MKVVFRGDHASLLALFLASLYGIRALFHEGLYSAHDIWHQVARLYHYSASLSEGVFMPDWVSNLAQGFGYPLFLFSYHLPWIIGGPLVLAGFSVELTLKFLFGLSFFLSGVSMYFLARELLRDKLAAFIAAFVYLWAPYHFLTLFVSASIGTAYLFVFLPMIIHGIWLVTKERSLIGIVLLSVGAAGGILSHLMTIVMLLPILGLFTALRLFVQKRNVKAASIQLMAAGLLTLGLTAFYLVPLQTLSKDIKAFEMKESFGSLYKTNFPEIKQLLYSRWGYAPITSNVRDGEMSMQIGIVQWIGVIGTIGGVLVLIKNRSRQKLGTSLLLCFLLTLFLITQGSEPLWKTANSLITLDYPFRLLLPAVVFGSLLSGMTITFSSKKILRLMLTGFLLVVALYTNRNHTQVNMYTNFGIDEYVGAEVTTNTFHEYLPKAADASLLKEEKLPPLEARTATILHSEITTSQFSTAFHLAEAESVSFKQFAFPNLVLTLNGEITNYLIDQRGRVSLMLPSGEHLVELHYRKPMLFQVSSVISAVSLGGVLVLIARAYYEKKRT